MSLPLTAPKPGSHARILLVDDEPMVLEVLRETLRREGFNVTAAANGADALEILRKQPDFALLLSDYQMPELTGLQFLAQAKEIQPDATRILITAVVSLDTVIAAINKGEIYRFLVKPWIREELLVTVKNGIQRYELLRQNAALQATTIALNETLAKLNQSLERQVQREADQNRLLEKTNQALEHNLRRSAELCMKTLQTFYPSLGTQARRTFRLCQSLATSLPLPKDQQQVLELSALLHNIGLLGVPRELIKTWQRSPQTVTDAERTLIQQHPVLGQELVGFIDHLQPVGVVIRSHRERYDGTGYPDRLAGESIPWLARLLAVAIFAAERDEEDESVLENLKRGAGSAFDPDAVRAFLRCGPVRELPRRQREVLLAELRPGMVLARSIYTSNGLLLFPEGQTLNTPLIDKLQNHNRVSPIGQALLVYS